MDAVKHENEGLRLNIREVQTLQAIVDTKVKYSKRLFYLFWCTIPYLKQNVAGRAPAAVIHENRAFWEWGAMII